MEDAAGVDSQRRRVNPYKRFHMAPVPLWLLRRPEISDGAKLCYGRLMTYAGKHGFAHPSRDELATEMTCSVRTVDRYITELERHGLIEVIQRGLKLNNEYYFLNHPWIEYRPDSGVDRFDDSEAVCKPFGHVKSGDSKLDKNGDSKPAKSGDSHDDKVHFEEVQGKDTDASRLGEAVVEAKPQQSQALPATVANRRKTKRELPDVQKLLRRIAAITGGLGNWGQEGAAAKRLLNLPTHPTVDELADCFNEWQAARSAKYGYSLQSFLRFAPAMIKERREAERYGGSPMLARSMTALNSDHSPMLARVAAALNSDPSPTLEQARAAWLGG